MKNMALPAGFEPTSQAPEASILSIELQERFNSRKGRFKNLRVNLKGARLLCRGGQTLFSATSWAKNSNERL